MAEKGRPEPVAYGDDDALRDLDRNLAGGVEDLIDGSYESVSALLEAVFDERGRIDLTDDDDGDPGAVGPGDQAHGDDGAHQDLDESAFPPLNEDEMDALASYSAEDEDASFPERLDAAEAIADPPDAAATCDMPSDEEEPGAGSVDVASLELPEGTLESIEELTASPAAAAAPGDPAVPGTPAFAAGGKAAVSGSRTGASAGDGAGERAGESARARPAVDMIHRTTVRSLRVLHRGLAPLSVPVRMVPVPLRRYLDFFALTVVFWVPLIWIAVLLMRPGS